MDIIWNFLFSGISIAFWIVVIFVPIVAWHELGHLLFSRLFGVKIPEFGIGLPFSKPLYEKTKWGIRFTLYPWLLGGFVRIFGDGDSIDKAQNLMKTDPNLARLNYTDERFDELVTNRDLKTFILDNNLEWNKDWDTMVSSDWAKGKENKSEIAKIPEFEALKKQAQFLIEWEFDTALSGKETFFSKNWIQQTLIICGGVMFNMIGAFALFMILFSTFGLPNFPLNKYEDYQKVSPYLIQQKSEIRFGVSVVKGSVFEKAGVSSGDFVTKIGDFDLANFKDIKELQTWVASKQDQVFEISWTKRKTMETKTATIGLNLENSKLGIANIVRVIVDYRGKDWGANWFLADNAVKEYTSLTVDGTIKTFSALVPTLDKQKGEENKEILSQTMGPIGVGNITNLLFDRYGFGSILYIMGILSISLAIFNILPIPALDGGRFIIITLNKILGKRYQKIENIAITVTFLLLMGLGIIVAFKDVWTTIFR